MKYIEKRMAPWEIKYGQIRIGDYDLAREIFKGYFGITFDLKTFKGDFPNQNFLHYEDTRTLRFACRAFFTQLNDGDIIFIQPISPNKIGIYNKKPIDRIEDITDIKSEIDVINKAEPDVMSLLIELIKVNLILRKENEYLLTFKEKLDHYQDLQYIFDDEKTMEDWLERNIHRAISDLEILDRQIYIGWKESFMRDRPDLFCIDKTTKELVVIENKVRGRHRNVDTQYLKYRTWVLDNLDDIKEKYKDKNLRPTEDFKFIIITDKTDVRLERICAVNKIGLILIEGGVNILEIVPYSLL